MKRYSTQIKAINPQTQELVCWAGPNVVGVSVSDAQKRCNNNGLGYCEVIGELIAEVPCKKDSLDPDFGNMIDYENQQLN